MKELIYQISIGIGFAAVLYKLGFRNQEELYFESVFLTFLVLGLTGVLTSIYLLKSKDSARVRVIHPISKISRIAALILILISMLFQYKHWPWAGVLRLTSLGVFFIHIVTGFVPYYKSIEEDQMETLD